MASLVTSDANEVDETSVGGTAGELEIDGAEAVCAEFDICDSI